MVEDSDYYSNRQKQNQPRVHSTLTQPARERLSRIVAHPYRQGKEAGIGHVNLSGEVINRAINGVYEDVGRSRVTEQMNATMGDTASYHSSLIEDTDTDIVLTYIEKVFDICFTQSTFSNQSLVKKNALRRSQQLVNTVMETEGILYEFKESEGRFRFRQIATERLEESDGELSDLALGEKWEKPLKGYDEAYRLYRERTYSYAIPESLYNAIEEVVKTICVDLESWEGNRDQNLSIYLNVMSDKQLFSPNNIMREELRLLHESMEKTFQKAGGDRKNRHSSDMDRQYATLLLAQVSAYILFIIQRYEEKYGS
ncbi:hypothetical protein [Haloprofundus salilacus]|uniref:hypothetical protein n=1 Tax=Haloprofundus salilacus TaxID=2876190 RepID=UPI001CCF5883|nr:hypothetical protein [Haloprofundus salilacus]